MTDARPYLWLLDSERSPLAECRDVFGDWADVVYIGPGQVIPDWREPPDAVLFSAEIAGGAEGALFTELSTEAGAVPLVAVARLRSLAQAVGFFRAGAADYLSLPLEEEDVRERLDAALVKAARQAVQGMLVELEPMDPEAGAVSLSLRPGPAEDEDILARLGPVPEEETPEPEAPEEKTPDEPAPPQPEEPEAGAEEEPEAVDGLPIPTLWEELPCGLLMFDSSGNLVFANALGLESFGSASVPELGDTLEFHRDRLNAYAANHKPLADNQWPHLAALRTRAARSAVISVEKPDRRRAWLRIDCLPHLADGKISRLTMTLVNLTGDLPPLTVAAAPEAPAETGGRKKGGKRRDRRRK